MGSLLARSLDHVTAAVREGAFMLLGLCVLFVSGRAVATHA